MPTTFYRCEICHREHETLHDEEKCEAGHLTVASARVKSYGVHTYPHEVEGTFSNGETRVYQTTSLT